MREKHFSDHHKAYLHDIGSVPMRAIEGLKTVEAGPSRLFIEEGESDSDTSGYISDAEQGFLAVARTKYLIPETYHQVLNSSEKEKWIAAIAEELSAIDNLNVYELVKDTPDIQSIASRWVFAVKDDPSGERFKARLVCKGFSQEKGVNFLNSWAPVMSFDTMRITFALAALNKYVVCQMDTSTAFLYGDIDFDVYVRPPAGTATPKGHLWKLKKGLYGLKQSPKIWYDTISKVLVVVV